MQVGTQPLFLDSTLHVYIFSQVLATLLLLWASFRTPTHSTLNGGYAHPLALIPYQLPSAPMGRQADRQTGGLYKAPGVKYIIEKLWL